MTDAPELHPEVGALIAGVPTCRHGNYTEADVLAIAHLAAEKAREEQREEDAMIAYEVGGVPAEDWQKIGDAIRRRKP